MSEKIIKNQHVVEPDGREVWMDYDQNGRLTHFKDSTGYEYWNEYDSNGNLIHETYADGGEIKRTFSDSNKITTRQELENGQLVFSEIYEYDENDRLIKKTYPTTGFEENYEYNSDGKMTLRYNNDGEMENIQYDQYGNKTSSVTGPLNQEISLLNIVDEETQSQTSEIPVKVETIEYVYYDD